MAKPKALNSTEQACRRRPARRTPAETVRLARRRTAIYSGPERPDRPLDRDIVVEEHGPRRRLILLVAGRPVSSTNICDLQQNFGTRRLRLGGIAGVHTVAEHRLKGYSRRVMVNSLRYMWRAGYDMALLFGIPAFYPKFGYAPVLPDVRFVLSVGDLAHFRSSGYRFVGFSQKYLKAVLGMYHRNNAARTGPIYRDAGTWRPFRRGIRWGVRAVCRIILDKRDKPAGYFVYDAHAEGARIVEVGFVSPDVFPAILAASVRLARRRGDDRIRFQLPEDSALMAFCKPFALEKHIRYRADGGAMARMINVRSTLNKLGPMLADRVTGTGSITIRTNLDGVSLAWSKGAMRISPPKRGGLQARLPQWALAQLLYGYQGAPALAASAILKASRQSVDTLARLFPPGPHYYYKVDSF